MKKGLASDKGGFLIVNNGPQTDKLLAVRPLKSLGTTSDANCGPFLFPRKNKKWTQAQRKAWSEYLKEYRRKRVGWQTEQCKKSWLKHGKKWYERARNIGQTQAKGKVQRAIKSGNIPSLKENIIKCIHCDDRATCYDHRDYNKPLEVTPVCLTCNLKLGPAIPLNRPTADLSENGQMPQKISLGRSSFNFHFGRKWDEYIGRRWISNT